MTTALTIEDRRSWEKDLIRFYIDEMERLGVPRIDEDDAWLNLRQQLMTALAFWTITLRPAEGMPDMQPERPGEVRHIALDTARAQAELDWRAEVGLADGLARTLDSLR